MITKCKICGMVVAKGNDINVDEKMWFHLRYEHSREFKQQENKEINDLFMDNFEKRRDL